MKRVLVATTLMLPIFLMADMDRCVSCHGVDFEKKALGVSKVVKNMSEAEIKKALDGYKQGKGGPLKDVMIKEVNVGVDTDAMAADVYNEIHTPGFEEPDAEFIFKKRRTVRGLYKIKEALKKADPKKDRKKVTSSIKTFAFDILSYDKNLRDSINFDEIKPKKLSLKEILDVVTKAKSCTDHSFTEEKLLGCRKDFVTLATQISLNDAKMLAKKIKPKEKKAEEKVPLTKEEARKAIVGTWELKCSPAPQPNMWVTKRVEINDKLFAKGNMSFYSDANCTKKVKEINRNYTFDFGEITLGSDGKEAWEVDKLIGKEKKPMYTMIRFLGANRVLVADATKQNDGTTKKRRKNYFNPKAPGCQRVK